MVHSTEIALLILELIPELLECLNEYFYKRLPIKSILEKNLIVVSQQCSDCENTIDIVEEVPCCSTDDSESLIEDFLSEIRMLQHVFEEKGIRLGTLLKQIIEDTQMHNLETSLSKLFELSANEDHLNETYFKDLLNAFIRFRILTPAFDINEINLQKQHQDFRAWQEQHRNYLYSVFGSMLAKYITLDENPHTRFLLLTIRRFLSTVKSYLLLIAKESLDIKRHWKVLFGNSDVRREAREEDTHLVSHFTELLSKIMSRYNREFLDVERIWRDVATELEQPNSREEFVAMLSRTFRETKSLEQFLHILCTKEITYFINWLSLENIEHPSFVLNIEVAPLEKEDWDFYADFLFLTYSYHKRGLRNLRTHYETGILGIAENAMQNLAQADLSNLAREFILDLSVLFTEYQKFGFCLQEIWQSVKEELELLEALNREGFLLPARVKFKTPLIDQRLRIEKFMRADYRRAVGFFIALVLYNIDNIAFDS